MKKLKPLKWLLVAMIAVLLGYGGYFYFAAVRPLQTGIGLFAGGGNESLSPEPLHFVLAGEDFWVPKYYLLLPRSTLKEPHLIDVYANWPDMPPRLEERKDRKLAQKNIKQLVTVVWRNKRVTRLQAPTVLETYQLIRQKGDGGGRYVETGETAYGLPRFITSEERKDRMYAEMYEERENGKLKSFITCSISTRNPTCASFQETEKFIVEIRFNRMYLSEWREVQRKGNALIETFRTNPATAAR